MTVDIESLKNGLPWYSGKDESEAAAHIGIKRESGRYEWGSGEVPYQHESWFRREVHKMRKEGKTEAQIAAAFNMTMNEYKARTTVEKERELAEEQRRAYHMIYDKQMSNTAVAKVLGKTEGAIRAWRKKWDAPKKQSVEDLADIIEKAINEKGMIDVGTGVPEYLGITEHRLKAAIEVLKERGYNYDSRIFIQQATNKDQYTTIKTLSKPEFDHQYVMDHRFEIDSMADYHKEIDENGKETYYRFEPPKSIDSSRIYVRYGDDDDDPQGNGKERDGLIQLRRGVEDISLGNDLYSQVRIAVDGTNYMKGIAVYSDDIPKGYDVVYNSNKPRGTPLFDGDEVVFKKMKKIAATDEDGNIIMENGKPKMIVNMENPFGSLIKEKDGQRHYVDENGETQLSVINKIRGEGDWDEWSRNLPTQFLAKQSTSLIKKQLNATYADKMAEFDEICSLQNDQIKKKFLKDFADATDKSAVDLKARALPGQSVQVILPDPNVKDGEIFAPNYANGTQVALIRYPHGGTFEIPILTVNNNVKSAKAMLSNGETVSKDAVVINAKAAARLSGADFDGDTVTVIPTGGMNGVNITSTPALKALENFDHQALYKKYDGMEVIKHEYMQKQMGIVSNLITDMTIKGASPDELARAVKHSMCIIDAEKHELDWKSSYKDNRIDELQKLYQEKPDGKYGGASTLFSRAKGEYRVPHRVEGILETDEQGKKHRKYIDPETGEKLYTETGKQATKLKAKDKKRVDAIENDPDLDAETKQSRIHEIYTEAGYKEPVLAVSTQMAEAKDARTLSSGSKQENLYADYANSLKALANKARLTLLNTPDVTRDKQAAEDYKPEVQSLKDKLDTALMNAPRERKAQLITNKRVQEYLDRDPSLKKDDKALKKIKQQLLSKARIEVGANGAESRIHITENEWEAIQKKAVSAELLKNILAHVDDKTLRSLAMPKEETVKVTSAKKAQIKARAASGYGAKEIAESLGLSVSTVLKYIK